MGATDHIEALWVPDIVDKDKKLALLKGCRYVKSYFYGKYGDIEIAVWAKENQKLYEVIYHPTGATKIITEQWQKAEAVAKQLSERCKMIDYMFR